MDGKRAGLPVVLLLVGFGALIALSQTEAGQVLLGRWSFTKSVEVDRGTYFRLKVKLAYKGEPQDFDIVVGCNVRRTTYKDGSTSSEGGVVPMVYGLKMPDGAGVVVRPPEACRGETTANGKVPPNLMPLVMTFENADEPWFGVGYGTDDAYDSPLSALTFGGATIEAATRADYDAWRQAEAAKNIVKPEMLTFNVGNPFNKRDWYPGRRYFPDTCLRIIRLKLPEVVREIVRPFWPEDHPTYWFGHEAWSKLFNIVSNADGSRDRSDDILFDGHRLLQYYGEGTPQYGVPRRGGGGMILYRGAPGETYPEGTEQSHNNLDDGGQLVLDPRYAPAIRVGYSQTKPENRGFYYCYPLVPNERNLPTSDIHLSPQVVLVNEQPVASYDRAKDGPLVASMTYRFFEQDSYVLLRARLEFLSIFGGL